MHLNSLMGLTSSPPCFVHTKVAQIYQKKSLKSPPMEFNAVPEKEGILAVTRAAHLDLLLESE